MPRIGRIYGSEAKIKAIALYLLWRKKRIRRRWWVHPLNADRFAKSEFFNLYHDFREYDERFFRMYRMHVNQFDHLLGVVREDLEKMTTRYREPISPEERLVITLT